MAMISRYVRYVLETWTQQALQLFSRQLEILCRPWGGVLASLGIEVCQDWTWSELDLSCLDWVRMCWFKLWLWSWEFELVWMLRTAGALWAPLCAVHTRVELQLGQRASWVDLEVVGWCECSWGEGASSRGCRGLGNVFIEFKDLNVEEIKSRRGSVDVQVMWRWMRFWLWSAEYACGGRVNSRF